MHNERDSEMSEDQQTSPLRDAPVGGDCHGVGDDTLDRREREAIDAWCVLGPDADGAPLEEASVAFVDGVMDRLATVTPRLVTMELDTPADARRRGGRVSGWLAGTVAAAAAAVVVVSLATSDPEAEVPTDAAAVLWPADDGEAESAGPNLPTEARAGLALPDNLDDLVEGYVADYGRNYGPAFKFHGVVVVARGGEVAYSRGFGNATRDGDPNTIDTRFRLGLLTEPITAVAVMQLVESELLALDAPIARYLPDYPRGEQITIRDLLTHRSGIPNYTDDPEFHTWKSRHHTTDAMVERFANLPLEFEPGADTAPSNSNYFLLGAIVERVTGQAFGEFVRDHQFRPAGMMASSLGDAFPSGEQAQGNVWNAEEILEPPEPIDMSTFGAAGGVVASPADLVKWDRALREGLFVGRDAREQVASATDAGYGFGWVVSRAYGQQLLSFPGAIDGYSGGMLRFERDGTTIIVLANTEVVPGSVVAQDIAMMVYGDAPPKRNEPAEIDIAPRTHHKYVGTYSISRATRLQYGKVFAKERFDLLSRVYVESEGDRLYFDVPGHARTWMHPMGRNRFFFKDHSGNQVSFELGKDRRAARLFVHYQDAEFELDRVTLD